MNIEKVQVNWDDVFLSKVKRIGKWTREEEEYTSRLINDFEQGLLPPETPVFKSMRMWLASELNCCPMRISKKFKGELCIGKKRYSPSPERLKSMTDEEKEKRAIEMDRLKHKLLKVVKKPYERDVLRRRRIQKTKVLPPLPANPNCSRRKPELSPLQVISRNELKWDPLSDNTIPGYVPTLKELVGKDDSVDAIFDFGMM